MRLFITCLALLCIVASATAGVPPPSLGFIAQGPESGWLLFTDQTSAKPHTRFQVLGLGEKPHAICCGEILEAVKTPEGREDFFNHVASDHPTTQNVFRVTLPQDTLPNDALSAMAVWNVSSVTTLTSGYLLNRSHGQAYEAESCVGSEGINLYLHTRTKPAESMRHYYINLGYSIGATTCR